MHEEKLYFKLFLTINIQGLCDDYDVAWGDDGEPFIFYDGLWWPICSMFFNDNAARLFCRQLEYDDGTFEVIETGHDYDLDIVSKNKMVPMKSFLVGNCTETDSTLRSCSGRCNPRIWRRDGNCGEESCDAENSVRMKVHCTMPPKTTTTVTVETTTNNTNMTTMEEETTSDTIIPFVARNEKVDSTETDSYEYKDVEGATDIDQNVTLDKGYDDRIDYDPDENNTTNASDTIDTNGTLNDYPNSKIPSNVKSRGILEGLNMDYIDEMDDAKEANMNEPGVGVTEDGEPIGKRSSCKGTYCSSNMKLLNFKNYDNPIAKRYMMCIYSLS